MAAANDNVLVQSHSLAALPRPPQAEPFGAALMAAARQQSGVPRGWNR